MIFHHAYIGTFFGQLYVWRNYLLTLLQSNYFNTNVAFSEQLLFQSFLKELPFSEQFPLRSSYFFRIDTFSEQNHCIFNLFRRLTSWKKPIFQKSNIPYCLPFLESYLFRVANFSKDLTFHGHYFFRRTSFLQDNFSEEQVRFLFTAIFPIYKLEIKWLDTSWVQ